jgi:hypothetical protein
MASIQKLPSNIDRKASHMRDNNVEAPKLCAEKETQVAIDVHVVQPKSCVVDPIQLV